MATQDGVAVSGHQETEDWVDIAKGINEDLSDRRVRQVLDVIDNIRAHEISRKLSLPELVVCGQQSSGKSSVLEAISRIRFPKGEVTCTRFVTEIQLVPADDWSVTASIRPYGQRTEAEKEKLRACQWSRKPDELQSIIAEASQCMGVGTGEGQALFSQDVLQIVVQGPDTQRLTLVDVPGLVAVNISGENEVKIVEDITRSYISKPNAIILAVVNADADPSHHKIMDMAKDVDPSAQRTFGIVTKPDLPAAGLETEQAWLRIIRRPDLSTHFKRGAHVLLNGTGRQVQNSNWSVKNRDENEKSFFAAPVHKSGHNKDEDNAWHALYKKDLWGIKSLRKRLTELLFEHTQRQIPNVHKDIELRLSEYKHASEQLGVVWKDPKTLKRELRSIMYKMASVTDHGSKGTFATYDGFFDFQKSVRWLRSRIRHESEHFQEDMEKKGHDIEFAWALDSEQPDDHKQAVEKYYQVIKDTKGPELAGNVDSIKLTLLFKVYSKQWQSLAQIYVDSAYNHCDKFIQEVVGVHMQDALAAMAGRLQTMVLEPLLRDRRNLAMEELMRLECDRNGPAITQHVQFWMENSERQRERFVEMSDEVQRLKTDNKASKYTLILKAIHQDTEEAVQREAALGLIRQMLIYYEIARARFIDNVIIQVVERRLLKDLETIFLTDWIEEGSTFAAVTTDPQMEDRMQKAKSLSKDIASLEECLIELRSVQ